MPRTSTSWDARRSASIWWCWPRRLAVAGRRRQRRRPTPPAERHSPLSGTARGASRAAVVDAEDAHPLIDLGGGERRAVGGGGRGPLAEGFEEAACRHDLGAERAHAPNEGAVVADHHRPQVGIEEQPAHDAIVGLARPGIVDGQAAAAQGVGLTARAAIIEDDDAAAFREQQLELGMGVLDLAGELAQRGVLVDDVVAVDQEMQRPAPAHRCILADAAPGAPARSSSSSAVRAMKVDSRSRSPLIAAAVPLAMMRPWSITETVSETPSTVESEWVLMSTAPPASAISRSSASTMRMCLGSRPTSGSSTIITLGWCSTAA